MAGIAGASRLAGVAASFEEALEMGDIAQVLDQIALGEVIDEPFDCGFTPLMSAAASGSAECCRALIDANANVNRAGKLGATPLIIACQHGFVDVAFELLSLGAAIDQPSSSGATALNIACQLAQFECVRLLLANGADVNLATLGGYTPLMRACMSGHRGCVEALLAQSAAVDVISQDGYTPMRIACVENFPEILAVILEAGSPPDLECFWEREDGTEGKLVSFEVACANGHSQIVEVLLSAGVSKESVLKGLKWAQRQRQAECVRLCEGALSSTHATHEDGF